MSELYRDFIDRKADQIINSLGGAITPPPANTELYRDFLDRKFDDVINGIINVLPIRTASGNPVTFNTSLDMPLVDCTVSFSPNTLGISNITLTINGDNIIIDLDGERHGGYIDLVEKKAYFTWYKPNVNNLNFSLTASGLFQTLSLQGVIKSNPSSVVSPYIMSDSFTAVASSSITGPDGANPSPDMVYASNAPGTLFFNYLGTRDINTFKSFLANDNLIVERKNPIVIDLPDIPTISTIIGNNSFASDTGNIDLKYRCLPIDLI